MRLPQLKVAALVVTVFILASCGQKDETVIPEPVRKGGTLREGIVQLASLDPMMASSVSERIMADQLYDGLTAWDPDTLGVKPSLAARWNVSADQKTWTFLLRPDALAANGEPVNAIDVKRSLERVARKSAGSVSTDLLSPIVGFSDFSTNDSVYEVTGIRVVDNQTIEFTLDQPMADFALLLGNPTLAITHFGPQDVAYTTGPMMVDPGVNAAAGTFVLKKSPGSRANLDSVNVISYPDVNAAYNALDAGQVDWTPVAPERAGEAAQKYGASLFRSSLRTLYLSFNTGNPKLADARFRQAVVQAIDRGKVTAAMGPTANRLDGVTPNGIPGQLTGGCGAPCAHDVAHAKELLSQVFPRGGIPTVSITIPEAPPFNAAATQQIVSDLAAVGITASFTSLPAAAFNDFTVDPTRELFQTSWAAAYPSAGAFVQPLFQSGLSSNVSALIWPEVDGQITAAATEPNVANRLADYRNVETAALQQMPIVPLASFPVDSVKRERVRGLNPLPTGNFDITSVWVTSSQS